MISFASKMEASVKALSWKTAMESMETMQHWKIDAWFENTEFFSQNSTTRITSCSKGRTGVLVEDNSVVAFKRGKFADCWMLIDFRLPLISVGTLVPEENRLMYVNHNS